MAHSASTTVRLPNGSEVRIRQVDRVSRDTLRLDVSHECRWRINYDTATGAVELVSSWDSDGNLADVPLPEWLDRALARAL